MSTANHDETAAERVALVVGGGFNDDALGDEYYRVIEAIRAAPADHLHEFLRMFVTQPASAAMLTELTLARFLEIVQPLLPNDVRAAATALDRRMGSLSQHLESLGESTSEAVNNARDRAGRQIDFRRGTISEMLAP
ncbi:hypothetical protein ACFOKI_05605 [Sphingomonas qilianensis]|uniref:Uncharacterized protein n=1 Tax=Sphingomonas qilianensis TaxID=1736690 RepID=A0ABU9XRL0_9SPHN